MTTIAFPKSEMTTPDFKSIVTFIKQVKRSLPAASDGAYAYFAEQSALAASQADNLDVQLRNALTALPSALDGMRSDTAIVDKIAQINEAERKGQIDADKAALARTQLQARLTATFTSTVGAFRGCASDLSDGAKQLSTTGDKIDVRLKTAIETENANFARAGSDVTSETTRLEALEKALAKLNTAVDDKRGKPMDELLSLIPSEKDLSGLLDLGAADAAAPEAAAAKKVVELAVSQAKKVLQAIGKTIEFEQLKEMRDQMFKAQTAQQEVVASAQERARGAQRALNGLKTVGEAATALGAVAKETTKLARIFSEFATRLGDLSGQSVTASGLLKVIEDMADFLDRSRSALSAVVVG